MVVVGNGEELPISHVGNSALHSSVGSLSLENVLCVPDIAKNLLSVSKLVNDNNVLIEFHADLCLVKDKTTGNVVLTGILEDCLYKLDQCTATSVAVLDHEAIYVQ